MTMNSNPLDYFAAPGVLEARQNFETKAVDEIRRLFPQDQYIEMSVNRLFEYLQFHHNRIDVPLVVESYKQLRSRA